MYLMEFLERVGKSFAFKTDLYNSIERLTDGFQLQKLKLLLEDLENYSAYLKAEQATVRIVYLCTWLVVSKREEANEGLTSKNSEKYLWSKVYSARLLQQPWGYHAFYANVKERTAFILQEAQKYVVEKIEEQEKICAVSLAKASANTTTSPNRAPAATYEPYTPVAAIALDSKIISPLADGLAGYFPKQVEELGKALRGHQLSSKITFQGNARTLVEVFRRVEYNGLTSSSKKDITNWLCSNFQYIYEKEGEKKVMPLTYNTVYEYLTKSKGDIRKAKDRICNIVLLPYKSHGALKKRDDN